MCACCTQGRRQSSYLRGSHETQRECTAGETHVTISGANPGTTCQCQSVHKVGRKFHCQKNLLCLPHSLHHLGTSAPEHFQKHMSEVLAGLDGVICMVDDILVCGNTREQHDQRLETALDRIAKAGVTLNADKCVFAQNPLFVF